MRLIVYTSCHQIEVIRSFNHSANTQGGAKGQVPGSNVRWFTGQRAVMTSFHPQVGVHGRLGWGGQIRVNF